MQVCDENHIDLYDGLILRVSAGPHLKSVAVADQTAVSARTGVRHRNPMRSRAVRLHPRWAVADLKRATCYASLAARPVFARYTALIHMPLAQEHGKDCRAPSPNGDARPSDVTCIRSCCQRTHSAKFFLDVFAACVWPHG
jgi:hypothetical protein